MPSLLPCSLGACWSKHHYRDVPARFERVPTTTPALAERLLAQRHEPESAAERSQTTETTTGASLCRNQYDREQCRHQRLKAGCICTRWPFRRYVDALLPILHCDGQLFSAVSPTEPSANRVVRHQLQDELVDQQEWHWRGHTSEHPMGSTRERWPNTEVGDGTP